MNDGRAERRLRRVLYLGGATATFAGLHTLLTGGRSFPPWRQAAPTLESELRFYSAFYLAYGLYVLRTAARTELDPAAIGGIAATLFLAGVGRGSAWLAVGKPHALQRGLLAIELAAPPLVVLQRARLRSMTPEVRR